MDRIPLLKISALKHLVVTVAERSIFFSTNFSEKTFWPASF